MTTNDSETSAKRYTLRPTFTPLPHAKKHVEGKCAAKASTEANVSQSSLRASSSSTTKPGKSAAAQSVVRAANEDDDLYDPYSDYHDGTLKAAEFEEDPWR